MDPQRFLLAELLAGHQGKRWEFHLSQKYPQFVDRGFCSDDDDRVSFGPDWIRSSKIPVQGEAPRLHDDPGDPHDPFRSDYDPSLSHHHEIRVSGFLSRTNHPLSCQRIRYFSHETILP